MEVCITAEKNPAGLKALVYLQRESGVLVVSVLVQVGFVGAVVVVAGLVPVAAVGTLALVAAVIVVSGVGGSVGSDVGGGGVVTGVSTVSSSLGDEGEMGGLSGGDLRGVGEEARGGDDGSGQGSVVASGVSGVTGTGVTVSGAGSDVGRGLGNLGQVRGLSGGYLRGVGEETRGGDHGGGQGTVVAAGGGVATVTVGSLAVVWGPSAQGRLGKAGDGNEHNL